MTTPEPTSEHCQTCNRIVGVGKKCRCTCHTEPEPTSDVAMQTRCINCGREQYGVAVYDISMGKHPCVWCGVIPQKLTNEEYAKKMAELEATLKENK